MVADRARRAPCRELAARHDFRDTGSDRRAAPGRRQADRRADPQIAELVLAQVEARPALVRRPARSSPARPARSLRPARRRATPRCRPRAREPAIWRRARQPPPPLPRRSHRRIGNRRAARGSARDCAAWYRPATAAALARAVSTAAIALSRSWREANPSAASFEVRANCCCGVKQIGACHSTSRASLSTCSWRGPA